MLRLSKNNNMKCQQRRTLHYLMKRKDCIFRFFYRLKEHIINTVHVPFTFKIKKRLSHEAGFKEMEPSEAERRNSLDGLGLDLDEAMYLEFENRTDIFEFVDVASEAENDDHTGNEIIEENWDLQNNPIDVTPGVEPCPSDNLTNDEQDYPNVAQLSVQPVNDENSGVFTLVTEQCSDAECHSSSTLRFTVKIENIAAFISQQRRTFSDVFICRDLPFRLIVQNRAPGLSLSAYVCRDKSKIQLYDRGLEIVAVCELSFVDQLDGTFKLKRSFTNSFRAGSDWGFCEFLDEQQAEPLGPGILHNNSLIIHVQIKAEPPFCYNNYSKAITGCVGIRNQGATCYMNSLLQVLYFLNKFRTACYRIPTEMDDKSSMALSIQKVFYNLEFSDSSACTKSLTDSFGWSTVDVLTQHDIQEMMRVLIDKIESRMKNTLLEPILPSMFQGKFVSYVKCRDIEFSSQREEVFYDIQLSLENSTNVYESFKRYVSPEMMDDDNKYHAGAHGLQAAEKGTLFISLPPVMFLHLLRFQFDGVASQVMKNNNFFEFYEHINLTEFVREEDATTWNYTLFAVLSHSGGGSHGHYVAYINPSLKGQWLKFDDETISLVSAHDAIDSNFGSNPDVDEWKKSVQLNAYMLVYVRDSMVNEIFEPTDPKYITEELKKASGSDTDERLSYNLKSYQITVQIFVFLCSMLESDLTFGLTKFANVPRFTVTRNVTTNDFKKVLQSAFTLSGTDQLRIWRVIRTSTNYSYPVYLNEEDPFVHTLFDYCDISRFYAPNALVWAEIASPGSVLPPFHPDKDVLVFYNYYCAKECRTMHIHHGYHDKNSCISELIPLLNQLMEWQDRELNIYRIIRDTKVGDLNPLRKFSDYAEHEHSTFFMHVVFEPNDHDTSTKLNSIVLYYHDILCRVDFTISNIDHPKEEENFEMSLESTFPEFVDVLARRLNCDRNKIQIFNTHGNALGTPVPSSSTEILKSIFNCTYQRIQLFYKVHYVDVIDVESKHNFTVHWLSIDMKKQDQITLYLSDDETIESILDAAKKIIDSDQRLGSGIFRLLSVVDDRRSLVTHVKLVTDVKEIYDYIDKTKGDGIPFHKRRNYRIEEIPKNDDILNENELYVSVSHSRSWHSKPTNQTHSFLFKVDLTESWQCVKDRLRSRLNLSEKNWSDYTAKVFMPNDLSVEINDDTKSLDEFIQSPEPFFICLNKRALSSKRGSENPQVAVTCDQFLNMFDCS